MEELFTQTIVWQEIPIIVSCICEWPINDFCHIEIRCEQRLPITETGYKSHFMLLEYLDGYDSYVEFVVAWLNEDAKSKEWQTFTEQSRQGNLFDL